MTSESLWMKNSLKMINELVKMNAEDIMLNERRKELDARKRAKLIEFREDLLAWVVEDQEVTREWEQSE